MLDLIGLYPAPESSAPCTLPRSVPQKLAQMDGVGGFPLRVKLCLLRGWGTGRREAGRERGWVIHLSDPLLTGPLGWLVPLPDHHQ